MKREISIAFQTDKSPAQYIALAKQVNQYDFDVVSVYCDTPFHPSYGPLMLMAPHIHRARIGPAAISPSRIAPIDIAASTALLSQIAKAGVYIGLARGAWLDDYGIVEKKPPVQAIKETIEVIQYLLHGNTGGYSGQIFRLAPHVKTPYPVFDIPIPIMIGTWGPGMCALAGELADEVKVGGSANPDIIPVIRKYISVGEQRNARDAGSVGIVMGAISVVNESREEARQAARRAVALYLPVVAGLDPTLQIETELIKRLQKLVNEGKHTDAARLISDDFLRKFAFAGTAADVIEQAEILFAAGASRIEFGTPHGLQPAEGIRILGEVVIPVLKRDHH
jgi:5,10-methylenetetrahydromethanopterin reductase